MAAMPKEIPCVLMRGGTSRGPVFRADWLPADPARRDRILLAALGSPHELQVDGIGGGNPLTSKAAIVARSTRAGCDIDYLFAQVATQQALVDTRPNCGNMLAAVAPFAVEEGLVTARDGETRVRIFNVNTGSVVEAIVQTPGGSVTYEGDTRIDGVAGTGAPILLDFADSWGGVTGALFPTGKRLEQIDGVPVTCIDAAMPLMIVATDSLGLRGDEAPAELDAQAALLARLEALRREAGRRMGMGEVGGSVVPKPVVVGAAGRPAAVLSRYFTPACCHRAHAVTGAIGIAVAMFTPGTLVQRYAGLADGSRQAAGGRAAILHPAGCIEIAVRAERIGPDVQVRGASVIRTARRIMKGQLSVPLDALGG